MSKLNYENNQAVKSILQAIASKDSKLFFGLLTEDALEEHVVRCAYYTKNVDEAMECYEPPRADPFTLKPVPPHILLDAQQLKREDSEKYNPLQYLYKRSKVAVKLAVIDVLIKKEPDLYLVYLEKS